MIYVVLGMHKSGTTLVAEILHKSGIAMGEDLDASRDYYTGNKYERASTRAINIELLGDRKHSLTPRPDDLLETPAIEERMAAVAATEGDWGFKDPRTCFTYSAWARKLPEHRIIAVYRRPDAVWNHYRQKNPLRVWPVMRSWVEYNLAILGILDATPYPALVLSFEQLLTDDQEFGRLQTFVGRELTNARRKQTSRSGSSRSALVGVTDCLMGLAGRARPSAVLKRLETRRGVTSKETTAS